MTRGSLASCRSRLWLGALEELETLEVLEPLEMLESLELLILIRAALDAASIKGSATL